MLSLLISGERLPYWQVPVDTGHAAGRTHDGCPTPALHHATPGPSRHRPPTSLLPVPLSIALHPTLLTQPRLHRTPHHPRGPRADGATLGGLPTLPNSTQRAAPADGGALTRFTPTIHTRPLTAAVTDRTPNFPGQQYAGRGQEKPVTEAEGVLSAGIHEFAEIQGGEFKHAGF